VISQANVTATTAPSNGNPTRKARVSRRTGSRTCKNFERGRLATKAVSASSSSSFTRRRTHRPSFIGLERPGRAPIVSIEPEEASCSFVVMFLTAWVADRAGRVAVDQVHQCSLQMDCTTCSSSQTTFDRERR
jgi:hypothetical protein